MHISNVLSVATSYLRGTPRVEIQSKKPAKDLSLSSIFVKALQEQWKDYQNTPINKDIWTQLDRYLLSPNSKQESTSPLTKIVDAFNDYRTSPELLETIIESIDNDILNDVMIEIEDIYNTLEENTLRAHRSVISDSVVTKDEFPTPVKKFLNSDDKDVFFKAMGEALGKDPNELRVEISNYIKAHRYEFQESIEGDFDRFIEGLRSGMFEGGDVEVRAAEEMFGRPVVFVRDGESVENLDFDRFSGEPVFVHFDGKYSIDEVGQDVQVLSGLSEEGGVSPFLRS